MIARYTPAVAVLALLAAGCQKEDVPPSAAATNDSASPTTAPAGGWAETVATTPEGGFLMGNPNAAVKLVEYGSRTCPHCAAFDSEGVPKLKQQYIASGKVSYEFRDFPVHGAIDMGAILLGRCVPTSAYFPLLDQMMAAQTDLLGGIDKKLPSDAESQMQRMSPAQAATFMADKLGYIDFMKQRGVTEAKARTCLTDPKALDAVAKMTEVAGDRYNVSGTPTFLINGESIGSLEWPAVEQKIKDALG